MFLQNVSLLIFQGANASALEKEIGPEQFPVNEHYFGLVNVCTSSNTTHVRIFPSFFPSINSCLHVIYPLVRQHLLLQLSTAGPVLLSALQGEGVGLQSK